MAKQNKAKVKKDYVYAVGRRKSAAARVRLFRGNGTTSVNGKNVENYFPGKILKDIWSRPFKTVDSKDAFYATVKVRGGGVIAQAEAVAHGISRTLSKVKKEYAAVLRSSGLLTRDARVRQRRNVGTGGKARRKKQSPKR